MRPCRTRVTDVLLDTTELELSIWFEELVIRHIKLRCKYGGKEEEKNI